MKIVIVSAMEKELVDLLARISNYETKELAKHKFYVAKYKNHDLFMTVGGIGKVQTGLILGTIFLNYTNIDLLINLGISGGVMGKVHPGDVVIGRKYSFADVNATFDGKFSYGQIPYLPKIYESDLKVIKAEELNKNDFIVGDILSGDTFYIDKEETDRITKTYFSELNVCAFDMESTAFAEGCFINNTPFISIRAISDIIGNTDQVEQYKGSLAKAVNNSTDLLIKILNN